MTLRTDSSELARCQYVRVSAASGFDSRCPHGTRKGPLWHLVERVFPFGCLVVPDNSRGSPRGFRQSDWWDHPTRPPARDPWTNLGIPANTRLSPIAVTRSGRSGFAFPICRMRGSVPASRHTAWVAGRCFLSATLKDSQLLTGIWTASSFPACRPGMRDFVDAPGKA
jgi:hypothetical protein